MVVTDAELVHYIVGMTDLTQQSYGSMTTVPFYYSDIHNYK